MSRRWSPGRALIQVLFMLYAISIIYPFIWMFLNSLKTGPEFYADIWSLPDQWRWSNYEKAWDEAGLGQYFLNSIYITAIGTLLGVMSAATSAYTVAKYKFPGGNIIFFFAVSTFLIPTVGSLAALYKLMIDLSLFNSHIGLLVLYSAGLGMNFIILYGFFKGVSWEYAEAAYMDGANDWQIFFRIMLPMAKPGLAAVGLITMINIWNDYFLPYMFLQEQKLFTISVGLYDLVLKQQYAADWTTLFAALTLSTVPVLIVYFLLQDKLISGLTTGGLKG
ncbi:carbohydrate ABC transporter permease [Paenibacillus sp. J5C_2022]|uniref:carbohydrate ABC transporter permease n=1 Tax=Paenibacillus sp. J5C2022 TaxID=2977129 RepID=UPI0021CE65E5|nr:carbohydrate ABC transporter permease [Paenibacillus sp. J5C2022]MCU6710749.1 carbohydrate ABC transporter permease [Paenibacillus sp. J5C2022]